MNKNIKGIALIVIFAALMVQFQNCKSNGFDPINAGTQSSGSSNQSSQNIANDGTNNDGSDENMELPNINNEELQAKPQIIATAPTSQDCSSESASMSLSVADAGSDILMCQEFALDMPVGSPRYGESYQCDNNSKFVIPPSPWTYDVGLKKWTHPTVAFRNHQLYVPGSYKIHVKDNRGQVFTSNAVIVKRPGKTNCIVTSTSVPTCTYKWEMLKADGTIEYFGGVQNMPQPEGDAKCTASSVGTIVNDLNTNNPGRLKCMSNCTQ